MSALSVGLLIWMWYDAWRGAQLGLSERTAATAEMLWPLVVVIGARLRPRRRARTPEATTTDRD